MSTKSTVLLSILLLARTSFAQTNYDEARAAFEHGVAALDQHRYEEAIGALERSRSIHDLPVVEYNLAIAYQGAGRATDAISAFERYLAAPDPHTTEEELETVRHTVAGLRASSAPASSAPASSAPPPPAPPRPAPVPPRARIAGFIGLGVGVAAVVAGVAGWAVREAAVDSYNVRCRGFGDPNPPAGCDQASAAATANAGQVTAFVAIPVGVVLAAVSGVAIGVTQPRRITIGQGPGNVGASVRVEF